MIKNSLGKSGSIGYIGEQLSVWNETASNSGVVTVATLTLTAGTWLVSGNILCDSTASAQQHYGKLYLKGVNADTWGLDKLTLRTDATSGGSLGFIPRTVTVASADTDKTVHIALSSGGTSVVKRGHITAVRLTP